MSESYKDIEERVLRALDTLKEQENTNIAKTAREFDVPKARLYRRWKGVKSRSTRPRTNSRLSDEQEKALCRYIDILIELDTPPHPKQITSSTNSILQ